MKKLAVVLIISFISVTASAQKYALKNNLLADATASINLGFEFAVAPKMTIDIYGSYNPFAPTETRLSQFRHWLVQPELRYWTCEAFNGLFFGVHLHAARYNVGAINIPISMFESWKDNRYTGMLYGAGVSIGHQWILGKRWAMEATIGGGYNYATYDKYSINDDQTIIKSGKASLFWVTKVGLSIVFFIR